VPWLHPDPFEREEGMSSAGIASIHEAVPPGVLSRHRASPFYPVQVPDLIGVKNRHYLDRTGLFIPFQTTPIRGRTRATSGQRGLRGTQESPWKSRSV
jgi:hypothetical protein